MITKDLLLKTKKEKGITVLAHYYTSPEIQDVADFIGDSLALAQYARDNVLKNVILCGVSFMAETIKILCPSSNVYIPVLNSPCSLANSCTVEQLRKMKMRYPDVLVVTYVNSSIDLKIESDIIITSSNALKIIDSIDKKKQILLCPDYNLGSYIKEKSRRDIILYDGACHVHNRFNIDDFNRLKREHPDAAVLGHPELSDDFRKQCDFLGSTSAILNYPSTSEQNEFIILTEFGLNHQLEKRYPDRKFYFVTDLNGKTNICNSMKLINTENLYRCMTEGTYLVEIEQDKLEKAYLPLKRMMELS